jgi:hypothetical protein
MENQAKNLYGANSPSQGWIHLQTDLLKQLRCMALAFRPALRIISAIAALVFGAILFFSSENIYAEKISCACFIVSIVVISRAFPSKDLSPSSTRTRKP